MTEEITDWLNALVPTDRRPEVTATTAATGMRVGRKVERNRRSRDHKSSHDEDDSSRSPPRSGSRDDKRKNSSRWIKPEKFDWKSSFETFSINLRTVLRTTIEKKGTRWLTSDGR
jgi:hypothetical protein